MTTITIEEYAKDPDTVIKRVENLNLLFWYIATQKRNISSRFEI